MFTPKETSPLPDRSGEPAAPVDPHVEVLRRQSACNVDASLTAGLGAPEPALSARSTAELLAEACGEYHPLSPDRPLQNAKEFAHRNDADWEQLSKFIEHAISRSRRDERWNVPLRTAIDKYFALELPSYRRREVVEALRFHPLLDHVWEAFVQSHPDVSDLVLLVAFENGPLHDPAWGEIVARGELVARDSYSFILNHQRRDTAVADAYLEAYPDNEARTDVVCLTEDPAIRDRLWEAILKNSPSERDLSRIMRQVEPLRDNAAGRLLVNELVSTEDLLWIMRHVERRRLEAWDRLKRQRATDEDLCFIVENIPSLRDDAAELFLQHHPEIDEKIQELKPQHGADTYSRLLDAQPDLWDAYPPAAVEAIVAYRVHENGAA